MSSMLLYIVEAFWVTLINFSNAGIFNNAFIFRHRLDALFKTSQTKKLTLAVRNTISSQVIDPNTKPWLITYASQTGVAEQLAWRTATSLQEAQQATIVKPLQQLTESELQQAELVLFVVSTYGTGEAPDLATSFSKR